ncbi:MAG: hydroxymethylglutaryl-CoA lyase [Thermodesulfobacteriota bacterium]|nr:hydroxymethylglutaryl-CoA lyase [Thermodesulfobacteriota bacterium]
MRYGIGRGQSSRSGFPKVDLSKVFSSMEQHLKPVTIQEVSMRDGLQNEPVILTPVQRINVIEALANAGLSHIQIGSFVNPRVVPQMAGTEIVVQGLSHLQERVAMSVLILSEKGLEIAVEHDVRYIEIYVSASDTHSRRNTNISVADAIKKASRMIRRSQTAGIHVTAGVMCAFGCFFEGAVPQVIVQQMVHEFLESGSSEIALADTTGMAVPDDVESLVNLLSRMVPVDCVSLHLHDTRGMGMSNLKAGLQAGVRKFDASVGGLGGCPFIPGATGNIDTFYVVEFLETAGFTTGVNLEKLRTAGRALKSILSSGAN